MNGLVGSLSLMNFRSFKLHASFQIYTCQLLQSLHNTGQRRSPKTGSYMNLANASKRPSGHRGRSFGIGKGLCKWHRSPGLALGTARIQRSSGLCKPSEANPEAPTVPLTSTSFLPCSVRFCLGLLANKCFALLGDPTCAETAYRTPQCAPQQAQHALSSSCADFLIRIRTSVAEPCLETSAVAV